jgi:tetratricopeptide (TPR) repeat protein
MDHLGILFKLKDLLKDTCGKQAISCLIQLPLITDYLNDPDNFQKVLDKFGDESQLWTPLNICRIASGIDQTIVLSDDSLFQENDGIESLRKFISQHPLEKINSIDDIYLLTECINTVGNKHSWREIFDEVSLGSYSFAYSNRILETIFTVVFEFTEDKNKFIGGLIEYTVQDAGPKLLARLLLINKSLTDLFIKSLETKSIKPLPGQFVSLLKEMGFQGDEKNRYNLAEKFVKAYPYDEKGQQFNELQGLEDNLSKLQYLKNYSLLFQIVGNKNEVARLSHIAKDVLSTLGQGLGLIAHFENREDHIPEDSSLDINLPQAKIIHELSRIKKIAKTDIETAANLAIEFSHKLLNNHDLEGSIFYGDNEFLIEPENLVQVYIDLGLLSQAQAILNNLLKLWPQNSVLIRMAANLAHDNGDHRNAADQFALLDIYDTLTREEKLKFASSLEYLDYWKYAFDIRKSINVTNDKDFSDTFLCAYYAGNFDGLRSLFSEDRQLTQSSALSSLLNEIAKEGREQVSLITDTLTSSDFSNNENHNYFLMIADYLHKIGEIDKAIRILEEWTKHSEYSFSIINRLCSYFQEKGESEKIRLILEADINQSNGDQKSFEIYINFLIQSGEIEKADQLLNNNLKSWELSPRKIDLSAKILIEKGDFLEAEKALHGLIENDNCDADSKFDFCLASLKCKLADFPFGSNVENTNTLDEIRKIVDFNNEKGNILFDLLDAELGFNNRFENYQQILQKYSKSNDPEIWRVYAGLGKIYFDLNQFDSAIINIKRAYQTAPDNQVLFWLLVRCFANLRLWREIESLLNLDLTSDSPAILRNFRKFGVLSENSEWPNFLENQVQKKPDEIVYKILLAQSFVESARKPEAVEIIKSFYEKLQVESEYYLFCVQILIDADEVKLAERLIEIFLVNKKTPDRSDYLSCAFLYLQLGKPEKALAMMNHLEIHDFALMTLKSKLLSDAGKIDLSRKLINHIIDNPESITNNLDDLNVRIPVIVKQIQNNPTQVYLMASSFALHLEDVEKAISILEKGEIKNPENPEILFSILELLNSTGKNEKLEKIIESHNISSSEIRSASLLCLLGEIALSQGEEVSGARYLSEAMKLTPDDPRIKALQARVMAINGNVQEAIKTFNEIAQEVNIDNSGIRNQHSFDTIDSKLWLANAAMDLKDYKTVLDVCQQEILRFGYFPPITNLFLYALSAKLENEFVLREIKVNKHVDLIQEELLKIYSTILENSAIAHSNKKDQNELIVKCQLFLKNDPESIADTEKLEPKTENINSMLYAIFKSKGREAAEIAFNSYKTNSDNELFLAILERDEEPEKALGHFKKANLTNLPDAQYHALLAIIEKNLGNLPDAYAAINLALEKWPDEYEWQILAGDLSKSTGDLHTSLSHYEKAQRLNLLLGLDKNFDAFYLSMETEEAIPILEKQLLQNPNIEKSIQLGKIFLKSGNYRKAVNVFESAIKENPYNAVPYYWLCEVALNLDNPGKALDSIEKAIANDGLNNQYICKKAEIINKIYGYARAISFIDGELSQKKTYDIGLLKLKIKLVSEYEGDKAALRFLNSNDDLQENPGLLFEKASLEFRLGNLGESETVAEKLLDYKDIKTDTLALLGLISKTRGEFDRAIDFYIKSIEANPFSIEKFIHLAEIYHDRKDLKLALETLDDGIRTNPGSFDLLYRSALYFYQHGLYNEAGKRIKEAIRIKPDHRDSKELLGLLENVIAIKNNTFVNQFAE